MEPLAKPLACGKIKPTMPVGDTVLLVFLCVAAVIHIGGIIFLGTMVREALRISRAVGALVIQEEEKTRRLFQR